MNKKFKLMVLPMLILWFVQMFSSPAYAFFEDKHIINQGLFTSNSLKETYECNAATVNKLNGEYEAMIGGNTQDSLEKDFGIDKDADVSKTQELMRDMTKPALTEAGGFFNMSNCSGGEELTEEEKKALTEEQKKAAEEATKDSEGSFFFKQLMVVDNPVNVTSNKAVMMITGKFQVLAFIFAAVSMVFYAITYSMGQQKLDPAAFIIRGFVVLLTVYFLPYLVQDLLNINNVIVNGISKIEWEGSGVAAGVAGTVLIAYSAVSFIISSSLLAATTFPPFLLFFLIFLVIAIYQILKPIISLTIWWYFRMLMIFVLTIIGPIMIVGLMLPQTSKFANEWVRWMVAEVFSQAIVMSGFLLVASLLSNYGAASQGSGIIGFFILMYAMVQLLNNLPEFADKILGGRMNISGLAQAQNALTNSMQGLVLKGGLNAVRKGAQMHEDREKKKKSEGDVQDQLQKDSSALQQMAKDVGGLGQRLQDIQRSDAYKREATGNDNTVIDSDKKAKDEGNGVQKFMGAMLADLGRGNMTKEDAKKQLAQDLLNRGFAGNAAQASMMAGQLIEDFEKQSQLGWDTQNQIGKLRASGDLTKRNLSDMIKADAQARLGMTNPKDLEGHAAQLMNDKGFNGLVGDMSRRQEAIENLNNTNLGKAMEHDGKKVGRVDFGKKDTLIGAAMVKDMPTPKDQREAMAAIAAQGAEGSEMNSIAGKETVNGKFDSATAQGAVDNNNNKMNYQGAVKNGKDGNYQMMYANADGKSLAEASKDLSPIGSVVKGTDGNYKVTGHTMHENGMVSMDVQQLDKNGNIINPTADPSTAVMSANMANTVAGNGTVGPNVSGNVDYVGATKQADGSMQMVYKAQDGQTLNAGNMATSFATVGSVTTDGQGNYFQVTGHTDLGNNTAAMSLQQIQSPVNTEQMAQGFAQAVNTSGATSQYTAQVVSQGADGSAQVQLTRTPESVAIAGDHLTVPQVTQGTIIDTPTGQAVVTGVSVSGNGEQIMATVAPVQSIATNNFDTSAATQSMAHTINSENSPKFTAASVAEAGNGGMVTLAGPASQVVASGNVASGGTVTLDNGRQAVITDIGTNDQGQGVVQYEYAPTNTEAVSSGLQEHFASSGVSVVGAGTATENGASFTIQADSPSAVQGMIGSTFQSSDGAQMVISDITQQADGGYAMEASYASVDSSSAAASFVGAMNDTVVSSITPTFETSSVTPLSGGGAVIEMTRNANDTSGYVPPTAAGDVVSLPNGQEGVVTSVQMSSDNNTFRATIAPKAETLGHVDTRSVAESVLSSSTSAARSSFEFAGAATVDSGTNEVVAVFNPKPNASISDHSVAQSFVQAGKEVTGANGVKYIVQEVAQNNRSVSVRMIPSTPGIQNNTGARQGVQQQVQNNRTTTTPQAEGNEN